MSAALMRSVTALAVFEAPRLDPAAERARCAWLLAVDVSEAAVSGAAFLRVYTTPEKVGRGSDRKTALARKIACYLAVTVGDVLPAVLARAARLDRKTVHSHLAEVEDMRAYANMDGLLDELRGRMLRRACALVMANLGGE